jgi:transcriptional regulator with XRE-family HTH domain
MKRLQCTKCQQIFWTDLDEAFESQVASGEWIKSPCPKCDAEWLIVKPATGSERKRSGRKARPAKESAPSQGKPQVKKLAASPATKEQVGFPKRIRSLRKKLGISQKALAGLLRVSTNSVTAWEAGKYQPKKDKLDRLAEIADRGKGQVQKMQGKKATSETKKKTVPTPKQKKDRRNVRREKAPGGVKEEATT